MGYRSPVRDDLGRTFKKLRLSVTSACNFNCLYCDPDPENAAANGAITKETGRVLSLNDYTSIVSLLHEKLDLSSVRITGGEPLIYKRLPALVRNLKAIGIPSVNITTNASRLDDLLDELVDAGLDGINISLDAVNEEVFKKMSGGKGSAAAVMHAVKNSRNAGLSVKINSTIVKGFNDSQVLPLLEFAMDTGVTLRYIELMEMGPLHGKIDELIFSDREILSVIGDKYGLFIHARKESSTARYITVQERDYDFGIISNVSHPFCSDCDRLRLSSDGKIYGCLSENTGLSISSELSDASVDSLLYSALAQKKRNAFSGSNLSMKSIGG